VGYGQFCPVARGAELFAERWTPLIVRELLNGSHRFNELRRGPPHISRTVLSERLSTLERSGLVERR
jgi:DNA-binding HxlR family transcriptional regulator